MVLIPLNLCPPYAGKAVSSAVECSAPQMQICCRRETLRRKSIMTTQHPTILVTSMITSLCCLGRHVARGRVNYTWRSQCVLNEERLRQDKREFEENADQSTYRFTKFVFPKLPGVSRFQSVVDASIWFLAISPPNAMHHEFEALSCWPRS